MSVKNSILVGVMLILLISSASAITGSIGNSRMIIRAAPGDTVEKYVLIKNVNDVSLNIDLLPGGDLANSTRLKESNFTLLPGEEKKAYFAIKAEEAGSYETKINIKFTPEDGNAVGLSSTVILIASDEYTDNPDVITDISDYKEESFVSSSIKNFFDSDSSNSEEKSSISPTLILLSLSTLVLALVLIGLVVFALKKKEGKNKHYRSSLKHEK